MNYQQTNERHYKDDESILSSLSSTSYLSSIDVYKDEFSLSNFKKDDIEKELENIFIGSESNGEKTEE